MARKLPQSADPVGKPRKRKSVADKAADLLNWMNDVGDEARGQIIAAAAYQCLIFYTS